MLKHPPLPPSHQHMFERGQASTPGGSEPNLPHFGVILNSTIAAGQSATYALRPSNHGAVNMSSGARRENAPGRDGAQYQETGAEAMLRRKTPGGVLNQAFDGSSQNQLHATKHIQHAHSRHNSVPNMPQHYSGQQPSQPMRHVNWHQSGPMGMQHGAGNGGWMSGGLPGQGHQHYQPFAPQQFPPMDSMTNRVPVQTAPFHFGAGAIHPYVFPPSALPATGPTTSNALGPWGPFWPNGAFEPYKPAAMRDPRYQHHPLSQWSHQHQHYHGPMQQHHVWNGPFAANQGMDPRISQHGHFAPQSGVQYPADASKSYGMYDGPAQRTPRDSFQVAGEVAFLATGNQSRLYSGQPMPALSAPHIHIGADVAGEFGSESQNGRRRDHVFNWAHSAYIDLLKCLHDVRRRNSAKGVKPARATIFPKPPQQIPSSSASQRNAQHNVQNGFDPTSKPSISAQVDGIPNHQRHPPAQSIGNASQMHVHQPHFMPQSTVQMPWHQAPPNLHSHHHIRDPNAPPRTLRRTAPFCYDESPSPLSMEINSTNNAKAALDALTGWCTKSSWSWVDGMLLGGCLAYAMGDYQKAMDWYEKTMTVDPANVEAMSNLAATLFAINQPREAEKQWRRAIALRPSYFEAVEHLVGLLCGEQRAKDAVEIIKSVEESLRVANQDAAKAANVSPLTTTTSPSVVSDKPLFDYEVDADHANDLRSSLVKHDFGSGASGYDIPNADVGRLLQLIHAKGNMLYAMGDNAGAAMAFEEAVILGSGKGTWTDIHGLIRHILDVLAQDLNRRSGWQQRNATDPILLSPEEALATHKLCFGTSGELPGLSKGGIEGMSRKASIATTSNSLLSLAKIFQDGMASSSTRGSLLQTNCGVREILALYYLSLALQPSPSTANNVGILLASVQQTVPPRPIPATQQQQLTLAGVTPGSGVYLALQYYEYGLRLDNRHAHLYTNLGSLLKDIGHLGEAVRMYQQAVTCDENFDIALANLANAVKDQGRINDAIGYYRRAVNVSPEFAEAVCGLANALNSVCGWKGRGGIAADGGKRDRWHVSEDGMLKDASLAGAKSGGWIKRVVDLVDKQLADGEDWGLHTITEPFIQRTLTIVRNMADRDGEDASSVTTAILQALRSWSGQKWEGAKILRLVERMVRKLTWQWYQDKHVNNKTRPIESYTRPTLPGNLAVPPAPTVLPFHTFTCPMSAKQVRQISQRNGLRISTSALKAPWLLSTVCEPPAPPAPFLRVGYLSSDFNNHPLSHLMQSVFGLHDPSKVRAICYATTASDNSVHRQQIEREAPEFYDVSSWSTDKIVRKISADGIHILVNLNGYTRGARNEVFAARPAPIQMSFMGFAGTLGAEWCDYLLADEISVPRDALRRVRDNVSIEKQIDDGTYGGQDEDWIYSENIIYCRDTFFCCDHRQSAPDAQGDQLPWTQELTRRWNMRKELFPGLKDDAIILGNFNQLYKIEPTTFRTWLRILARVPNAVLWLLRFPDLGEQYLREIAELWAGQEVASRVIFTDVAPKNMHIARARVCDLFLDTPECNAHTTAADTLWSGTPLLTLPRYKYKMCSRMAASILTGALPRGAEGEQAAKELIASCDQEYEDFAVKLASGLKYEGITPVGRLAELRKLIYEGRWEAPLFDTKRWVRDLEEAYEIAWERWVKGVGGDITLPPRVEEVV